MLRRRELLAAGALLAGCAPFGTGSDRITDTATGETLMPDAVLARLRAAELVLLGELHDNPWHHERRAALLRALGRGAPVVAEHLPRGAPVDGSGGLDAALKAAGFEPAAWDWPLHRPLFEAVRDTGARLTGGNAPRELVRRVARDGRAAVPAELLAALDRRPLSPAAQEALDADLAAGHCGHLRGPRLEAMRWAQRVRDLSMLQALDEARAATGAATVVLLAGNGHVRRDYGVPQLAPARRCVSVVFVDADDDRPPADLRWQTPAPKRDDPCRAFSAPASAAQR